MACLFLPLWHGLEGELAELQGEPLVVVRRLQNRSRAVCERRCPPTRQWPLHTPHTSPSVDYDFRKWQWHGKGQFGSGGRNGTMNLSDSPKRSEQDNERSRPAATTRIGCFCLLCCCLMLQMPLSVNYASLKAM